MEMQAHLLRMARATTDGIRAKIPSHTAPAWLCLATGSVGRGRRDGYSAPWGFFGVFGLGFLASQSHSDSVRCGCVPRPGPTAQAVKSPKGWHRWESYLSAQSETSRVSAHTPSTHSPWTEEGPRMPSVPS